METQVKLNSTQENNDYIRGMLLTTSPSETAQDNWSKNQILFVHRGFSWFIYSQQNTLKAETLKPFKDWGCEKKYRISIYSLYCLCMEQEVQKDVETLDLILFSSQKTQTNTSCQDRRTDSLRARPKAGRRGARLPAASYWLLSVQRGLTELSFQLHLHIRRS